MKKPIIEIKNLSKKYKNFYALKNINLTIYENEKLAIIGANGAGKTTLVEIISGIRTKTIGTIKYNFKDPKQEIALQIQDNTFPVGLKLKDLITFYCSVYKKKLSSNEINELLSFFQLEDKTNTLLSQMSGGQRQRANVFLTILSKPKLLIVDEIATGLDITTKIRTIDYISKYIEKHNITYITISHSETEIAETTNRVVILESGSIVNDCSLEEIGGKEGIYNYFQNKIT